MFVVRCSIRKRTLILLHIAYEYKRTFIFTNAPKIAIGTWRKLRRSIAIPRQAGDCDPLVRQIVDSLIHQPRSTPCRASHPATAAPRSETNHPAPVTTCDHRSLRVANGPGPHCARPALRPQIAMRPTLQIHPTPAPGRPHLRSVPALFPPLVEHPRSFGVMLPESEHRVDNGPPATCTTPIAAFGFSSNLLLRQFQILSQRPLPFKAISACLAYTNTFDTIRGIRPTSPMTSRA